MPFTTGTAISPSDLMNQINTFVTANGWTKLRGELDLVPASPKNARYWRIVITETVNTGDLEKSLREVELRTTLGGANVATTGSNWTTSDDDGTNVVDNLASGDSLYWRTTAFVSSTRLAWVAYDFGASTIIRQAVITSQFANEAPRDFTIQWSHDNVAWCTMLKQTGLSWTAGETKTFNFDTAFVDGIHPSSTIKRTTGVGTDISFSDLNDDYFIWQGPGFDAARRVHVGMRSEYDLATNTHWLDCVGMTGYDSSIFDVKQNENAYTGDIVLTFDTGTVNYWLYVNSSRIFIAIQSGVTDYTTAYLGNGAPFALPAQWSFPLILAATSSTFTDIDSTANNQSSCCDPGETASAALQWDNIWKNPGNRNDGGEADETISNPDYFTWPWHTGQAPAGNTVWPNGHIPSLNGTGSHYLDKLDATDQSDLPVIATVISSTTYGNVLAMIGVFAVPNPGTLSPEQVLTISAQDYKIFPNRSRRDGNHFFCIRED